nr:MAG TPA: Integrase [Caudoviricetes sp.]
MKNSHSEIKIVPKNWEKNLKSNIKKEWYGYYFYFTPEHPEGYLVKFRGMNRIKDLEQRQKMTRILINSELDLLSKGYNPITKQFEVNEDFVTEKTPFLQALEIARKKIKVAESTMTNIVDVIKLVTMAANKTGVSILEIGKVKKRDIRQILDVILEKGYSNDRYNKVKAVLGILYNYFVDLEIFEYNYCHFIKKLPHTPAPRVILRKDDKERFEELKTTNYNLWRFCKMFYYSGCRISEFRALKIKDINLKKQEFKIFEKKGKRYHEVLKPININVYHLWKEILSEGNGDDLFLFGNDLSPAEESITKHALSHRYRRWVVKKLGIKVDLYALRHTYLNDITTIYGISKAKDIAGHTNERTTRIYAVDYNENILNEQKKVSTGF